MPTQTVPPNLQQAFQKNQAIKEKYERAIGNLESHVKVLPGGTLSVDISHGADVNVDEDVFVNLTKSIEHTNALIKTGQLRTRDVLLQSAAILTPSNLITAAGACAGKRSHHTDWWGGDAYIDECQTQEIISILKTGGATAGQIIAILGFDIGPIISFILAAAAGLIDFIDGLGGHQGIYIWFTWIGPVVWIWHQ